MNRNTKECFVCKKRFMPAPLHMYKLIVDRKTVHCCSYTCYTKAKRMKYNKAKSIDNGTIDVL